MAEERGDRSTEGEYGFAGYTIYDRDYEKIGKVDDLFVDENDQPEYIGVKMGFLGTKSTLIPIELVRINEKRKLVEVVADKETVKEGPTFADDQEITAEFERRVHSYYRVETARTSSAERGAYGAYYSGASSGAGDANGDEQVDVQPGERLGKKHSGPELDDGERERGGTSKDELRMQRVEEELRVGTREHEAGRLNVRKRVRTDRERVTVPKKRQEVRVDRVRVEEGREDSKAEIGEDEVRVPVVEEEIVVEKRPVVKEEIRVHKNVVEDEDVVEEDVRREEVDVEDATHSQQEGEPRLEGRTESHREEDAARSNQPERRPEDEQRGRDETESESFIDKAKRKLEGQ